MKKLRLIIAFVILSFAILTTRIDALTCEYSDGKLTAKFDINESKQSAGDATINGTLNSSDEPNIKNEKQGIENWTTKFKPADINAIGKDYYANHKDCPPYSIFVDRTGQFDFAVFTESHKEEFEEYGKSKQGYAIMPLVSSSKPPETDGSDIEYEGKACFEYTEKSSCENNSYFACVWNETEHGNYCNTDSLRYVQCGDAFDIPYQAPGIISFFVNLLKIATPIILIIVSIISLLKAVAASNEDEIKKAQKGLIRKVIAAVMVFFVISIVQFVIMKVADTDNSSGASEADNLSNCLSCFLNNDCGNSIYYKTNIGGTYFCKYLNGDGSMFRCEENK